MVETIFSNKLSKGIHGMTLGAFALDALIVGISMTGNAIIVWDIRKHLKFLPVPRDCLMTFFTIHSSMFTRQFVVSLAMVKLGCRFEGFHIVAGKAIRRQGFLVIIIMAGKTFLL